MRSLNPCYDGIRRDTNIKDMLTTIETKVLILVMMEYVGILLVFSSLAFEAPVAS